jgi:hypothetical protein
VVAAVLLVGILVVGGLLIYQNQELARQSEQLDASSTARAVVMAGTDTEARRLLALTDIARSATPTLTATFTPSATITPTHTPTATTTSLPTSTPTLSPTPTFTRTPTSAPTHTASATWTLTSTLTLTIPPTFTFTPTTDLQLMAAQTLAPLQSATALALQIEATVQAVLQNNLNTATAFAARTQTAIARAQATLDAVRTLQAIDSARTATRVALVATQTARAVPTNTLVPTLNVPTRAAPTIRCENFLPSRLFTNSYARIKFVGTPNRLRRQPAGSVIVSIPNGQVIFVFEGPACGMTSGGEGIAWWRVQWINDRTGDVFEGWTAEGQGQEYFIDPLPADFTPTPTAKP